MSEPLIFNGTKAPLGAAPWNVGVYEFKKGSSNYKFICGGTIISPNLVVSGKMFEQKIRKKMKIK